MDLETFIIAMFCLVDDFVRDLCRGHRLRQRGPAPILADSEVLTVEITGAFLGLDTDRARHAKRVRARDEWHRIARWLRKLASHTVAILLCQRAGFAALAFSHILKP